jgi:hypothetical protein
VSRVCTVTEGVVRHSGVLLSDAVRICVARCVEDVVDVK